MIDASEAKRAWWQWFLLYPTVGIALVTAAPQWLDHGLALWHGTRSASYADAERQSALWRENLSCAARPFNWYRNPSNTRVDATVCESGDVFVRIATPDNRNFFQWVDLDAVVGQPGGGGPSLIPQAHAATISRPFGRATPAGRQSAARLPQAPAQARTLCQGFLDQRRLRSHIQTPAGCFDQIIDTLSGAAVQLTRVRCRPAC